MKSNACILVIPRNVTASLIAWLVQPLGKSSVGFNMLCDHHLCRMYTLHQLASCTVQLVWQQMNRG